MRLPARCTVPLSITLLLLTVAPLPCRPQAGLRGINLSGGQRQRLNLARCAYFGGDLVLLDNALSAVDHHTAQHIFQYCVKDMFRDKATILVTHQVEFLPQCDKVAIMDDGNCVYFGPWNEGAAQLLSKYLPASHLLAAAGQAEQPRDTKKKPAKKAEEKKDEVGAGCLRHCAGHLPAACCCCCCCCC
jgi:ABC-type multidrug transport system ATPase subunit